MVRAERAAERERIRAERDAERRRLEWERTNAVRTKQAEKQAAKEAQLRAWKLEFEAHQERETDIDRIGNDAPEVEDRDQMYAVLGVRRAFEPEAFAPPLPHRSDAEAHAIHAEAAACLHATMTAFHPDVRKIRLVQAVGGAVAALGLLLMLVSGAVGLLAMVGGVGGASQAITARSFAMPGGLLGNVAGRSRAVVALGLIL
ncbi:hypothetical protein AKJ09_11000 [Labilithrix luteola]|uniref:Uncharacterized protein n=2 Tax=Labilithrix luteola TaxID=1391654 RepID=A0A0K1QFB2_9BACT|nr:hypothetical protein AKJ09_11000 [Labilithrix luteola]